MSFKFTEDLGIDMGTSSTLICVPDEGVVLNEPSLVIKNNNDNKISAIGEEASEMLGRTPEGISAVTPIREGTITGFYAAAAMLKYFVGDVTESTFSRVRAVITIPCDLGDVGKRAMLEAASAAGINDVYLLESPLAAAIGCGIDIGAAKGTMVVDIGAGVSQAAVVSLGGIVVSNTIRTAGMSFDNAIIQYIKKQYSIIIGDSTAEGIKIAIGSVYSGIDKEVLEVNGRDMVSGLPKSAKVSNDEIRMCLSEYADAIVENVKMTLEDTPPELAADILESGIVLTGGGAMLKGIGRLINTKTEVPVFIAENPVECTALGAAKALDFMANRKGKGILGR